MWTNLCHRFLFKVLVFISCQHKSNFCVMYKQYPGTNSNCILKFPVFPLLDPKFSLSVDIICDYYIQKTDLADLFSSKKNLEIFEGIM